MFTRGLLSNDFFPTSELPLSIFLPCMCCCLFQFQLGNAIGVDGAVALAAVLKNNLTLTSLDLSRECRANIGTRTTITQRQLPFD